MGIVNGTFDNPDYSTPSGWNTWVNSPAADVLVIGGKARLKVNAGDYSRCSSCRMWQGFIVDGYVLSFDFSTYSPGWAENIGCRIFSSTGALIKEVGIPCEGGYGCSGAGTIDIDLSAYYGQNLTIQFYVEQGVWCFKSDHYYTHLWIDNVRLSYREATLASCQFPTGTLIAGQAYQVAITVNQGSRTENYKLVFSGDFVGESAPFMVNAGTGQQQFTAGNLVFTTGGAKNITASLVKA